MNPCLLRHDRRSVRSAVGRRRVRVLAAAPSALFLLATGCSDEQRRDFGEEDVRIGLISRVDDAVAERGLEFDGDPECTSDLDSDGVVTGSCNGTTTSGEAVTADLTGTANVDDEECSADLVIEIGGDGVVDETGIACFDEL